MDTNILFGYFMFSACLVWSLPNIIIVLILSGLMTESPSANYIYGVIKDLYEKLGKKEEKEKIVRSVNTVKKIIGRYGTL